MLNSETGAVVRLGGSPFPGGLARQTQRQIDGVAAKAEVNRAIDQSRALLTSSAIGNVGNLTAFAEQIASTTPSAAGQLETLLGAYTLGAARQIASL